MPNQAKTISSKAVTIAYGEAIARASGEAIGQASRKAILCQSKSYKTLNESKFKLIPSCGASKVVRPKLVSGRAKCSQQWLPVKTGKPNVASTEAQSSWSSVPPIGTNLKASFEANTWPGTGMQASREAKNLVSSETKYQRKQLRSCGANFASCEAKNLVSSETKYHKRQIRSCGANFASCKAEILPGSISKKAFAKAKYHAGTAPPCGAKCCKALSANNAAYAKAKCLQSTSLLHSAKIQSCETSPRACAPLGATNVILPEFTKKAFFKARQQRMVAPTTQGVESKPKEVMGRLGLLNSNHSPDLREYLSSKRKLRSNEIANVSPSQCEQVGCKLVTVHSVRCCLGSLPTTLCEELNDNVPFRQSVFDRLSSTSKRQKSLKKNPSKNTERSAATVNMTGHGEQQSRRRR
jgi:hypothetical protein